MRIPPWSVPALLRCNACRECKPRRRSSRADASAVHSRTEAAPQTPIITQLRTRLRLHVPPTWRCATAAVAVSLGQQAADGWLQLGGAGPGQIATIHAAISANQKLHSEVTSEVTSVMSAQLGSGVPEYCSN